MKTIRDLDLKNKKVLLRVDFNVPIDANHQIKDDTRIKGAVPTIEYLLRNNVKQIILISHLGRPKNKVEEKYRLKPVASKLAGILGQPVAYSPDLSVPEGKIVLLENIRFYEGEEKNDPVFCRELASKADVYINDAFGTAHRAHASTCGVASFLPHAAGLLMEKEVTNLSRALANPEKPIVAIIGGAKISTKIKLIRNLLPRVDKLLLGGALANTMLLAQKHKIGKSLVETDLADTVKDLLSNKLHIPVDVVVAKKAQAGEKTEVKAVANIAADEMVLDIGPDTIGLYCDFIKQAKTIIWNGPMGIFEIPDFANGTLKLAQAMAETRAFSVIGGGETVEAVEQSGVADKISFISTGGGAMLEYMEGKELPGIKALE